MIRPDSTAETAILAENSHPLVRLALAAIREYVLYDRILSFSIPVTEEIPEKAGVFVSLKKDGGLRGCIGTITATMRNVAEEVIHNAIRAASEDFRFPPVEIQELNHLTCTVDILSPLEPVRDLKEMNPTQYGVLVQQGIRKGLLLPDLPDVTSVDQQIVIAKEKAAIPADEPCELFRFRVKRYR